MPTVHLMVRVSSRQVPRQLHCMAKLEQHANIGHACRGRFECCRALLRAGADPNYMNAASDLALFWATDGGVEIIKLFHEYGADLDARTPKVHRSSCRDGFCSCMLDPCWTPPPYPS